MDRVKLMLDFENSVTRVSFLPALQMEIEEAILDSQELDLEAFTTLKTNVRADLQGLRQPKPSSVFFSK